MLNALELLMPRESISELNQKLIQHGVESVIAHLVGSNNYKIRSGRVEMAGYQGGQGDSFQIPMNGKNIGYWFENNPQDGPNGKTTGDLIELWSVIKSIDIGTACKEVRAFLNIGSSHVPSLSIVQAPRVPAKQRFAKKITPLKPASTFAIEKLEKRLHANANALSFLFARSLSEATIKHFKLGLSQPYETKNSKLVQVNSLVVPVINKDGKYCTPNCFYNIPSVTKNPLNDNGWKQGSINLYYNVAQKESHEWMIVAEGMKDLWALHQLIADTDLEHRIIIVTSTHGSKLPVEIDNPLVFAGLKKVFLGHDADPA